ncbi:MAG: bifunctional metallophosphatase/5'-nucleotidase [Planctomycetes bacterium]|nr:bifunctional metallophosphatase/5'-nucleotidase [Planctomycetota bacterium]
MKHDRSILAGFWVLWLWLGAACAPLAVQADAQPVPNHWRRLIILHTNDMHGQVLPLQATWLRDRDPVPDVGGVARLAAYVNKVRAQAEANGDDVLVLDAGDWYQGTPEGSVGQGLSFLEILGQVGYDAMCVGNHEMDHGVAVLEQHLLAAKLPALLANVSEPSGVLLRGTEPYKIVQRAGLRIALVGLLTTETPRITHPSASTLFWAEPAVVLESLIADLEGQVDWILPLTHQGYPEDMALAEQVPGLPLLIGGHSHTLLPKGDREGETWIVQAGSKVRSVGRIEVWVDPVARTVERIEPSVVDLLAENVGEARNAKVEELAAALLERSEERMAVVVGQIEADLVRGKQPFQTSSAGNWVTDVMLAMSDADVAIQNRGGIRANLSAGPLTRRDIFRMLPFDNTMTTLTLTGQQLLDIMRRRVEGDEPVTLEMSGMQLVLTGEGEARKLLALRIQGQPVEPERSYRLVTNSYLAGGGDGFDEFCHVTERTDGGELHRDLVERYLVSNCARIAVLAGNRYRFE